MKTIIVGGGVLGLTLLDVLARRGQKALLLEQDRINSGATGYSGAMVRIWQSDSWQLEQTRRSWDYWQQLPFVKTGSLYFETEDSQSKASSLGLEWVSPAAGKSRFPSFCWESGPGAVFEPEAGWMDTGVVLKALAQRAVANGGELLEQRPVRDLVVEKGRVVGVRTHEVHRAEQVVWAAGPSSTQPLENHLSPPPSQNRAIQMIRLHLAEKLPCFLDRASRCFARSLPDGSTWAGVALDSPLPETVAKVCPNDAEKAITALAERWKPARGARWTEGFRVADRYTPNRRPYLGASELPGLYWAWGGSGASWKFAPALAADLADRLGRP